MSTLSQQKVIWIYSVVSVLYLLLVTFTHPCTGCLVTTTVNTPSNIMAASSDTHSAYDRTIPSPRPLINMSPANTIALSTLSGVEIAVHAPQPRLDSHEDNLPLSSAQVGLSHRYRSDHRCHSGTRTLESPTTPAQAFISLLVRGCGVECGGERVGRGVECGGTVPRLVLRRSLCEHVRLYESPYIYILVRV